MFVDDISNWYIRTNRRRFWKAEDAEDKMIAYYTLFYALNTCVRVMAPIIPFMTEGIWQKLTRKVMPSSPISVHLTDFPKPTEMFEDDGILAQTATARDIIATAMRLRNEQQLKVRQPLAKLFVCTEDAEAIRTFERSILDELNIKEIEYITDFSVLEESTLGVNFKAAGAVLKKEVNNFKAALENASAEAMQAMVAAYNEGKEVTVPGFDGTYATNLFVKNSKTKSGIVSAKCTDGLDIALDVVLTDALRKEGAVHDVIRQCQLLRKEAGYSVEQRIT